MKWKLLWRRLSVAAPRMTIKTHRPWWLQALVWIVILGLSGALALWTYDLGRSITGLDRGQIESKLSHLKSWHLTQSALFILRDVVSLQVLCLDKKDKALRLPCKL